MRNGINIASISELVQEIRDTPQEARYVYTVHLHYRGGHRLKGSVGAVQIGTITAGRNFTFDIDIKKKGSCEFESSSSYTPEDLFTAGLGGCVMLTTVMGFTTQKVSLNELTIDIDTQLGTNSKIEYMIKANTDGSAAQSDQVIELVTAYSPNHRTIVEASEIDLSVKKQNGTSKNSMDCHLPTRTDLLKISANCHWDRALQLQVQTSQGDDLILGQPMLVDAPKQIGGIDLGPNPQEYLLMGLGADILREFLESDLTQEKSAIGSVDMQMSGVVDLRGIMRIDDSIPVKVQEIDCKVQVGGLASEQEFLDAFQCALEQSPLARLIREPNHVSINTEKNAFMS
jgi:uncharacterized OsmC-like protein